MKESQKRYLTLVGDPNQVNTWSNIPYFFLLAGQSEGFLDIGLPLQPQKLRIQRWIWNLNSWLQRGETGGFQYSSFFLNRLFSQVSLNGEPVEFISHFPLLPPAPWETDWIVNYYIDATLHQNFEDYGLADKVGQTVQKAALEQEQKNYEKAQRIVCMSHSAAQSVVTNYSISSSKVHVIPGGTNFKENTLPTAEQLLADPIPSLDPLRLGFIGKDWRRKGLSYALQIAETLHSREIAVEVMAIGPSIQELSPHPLIKPLGFIDKAQELPRFIQLVRSFHFGCLFSSAEAFGISNLECLRLGIPVLASNVGGIPDTVPEGLGFLIEPESPPQEVADLLERFVQKPSTYSKLRRQVAARAGEFTWQQTVKKFQRVWQGSKDFCYDAIAIR